MIKSLIQIRIVMRNKEITFCDYRKVFKEVEVFMGLLCNRKFYF